MSEPLIDLRNVTKAFGGESGTGLRDAELQIWPGEFVAVVGPSGAGKSTLLNLLGLLDRPDSGTYLLDGVDTSTLAERDRDRLRSKFFGFVFQSAFVLGDENTMQNAALGLRVQGWGMHARTRMARQALATVGIGGRAGVASKLLSGGERQRLALARAIATHPSVILADEPTGNLDRENGRIVLEQLWDLNKQGVTVILITHDPEVANQASRCVHVEDGRVTGGSAEPPQNKRPRVGRPNEPRGGLFAALADDFGEAVSVMGHRALRTALLVAAFTLGIGGLVTAAGLSETASAQVSQRLTQAALDEVRVVLPGGAELLADGHPLLDQWIQSVAKLPHVQSVGWVAQSGAVSAKVRRLASNDPAPMGELQVLAASPSYFQMQSRHSDPATVPSVVDVKAVTNSAWLGTGAAKVLGTAAAGPGSTIWAFGKQLTVVGSLAAMDRAPQLSNAVVVSPDVIAGASDVTVSLLLRTDNGYPATLATAIPVALDPTNPGKFSVETVADLRNLRLGVANDLGSFVAVLSAILLVLAAVSAATTMNLAVHARRQEIALRRAIGASRHAVARLFMMEGITVGLVGGVAGAVFGTIGAVTLALAKGWEPVLPAGVVPLALGLGILTGLVSSLIPAWSASRSDPATAIRG